MCKKKNVRTTIISGPKLVINIVFMDTYVQSFNVSINDISPKC